jgi:hypothetical protein
MTSTPTGRNPSKLRAPIVIREHERERAVVVTLDVPTIPRWVAALDLLLQGATENVTISTGENSPVRLHLQINKRPAEMPGWVTWRENDVLLHLSAEMIEGWRQFFASYDELRVDHIDVMIPPKRANQPRAYIILQIPFVPPTPSEEAKRILAARRH